MTCSAAETPGKSEADALHRKQRHYRTFPGEFLKASPANLLDWGRRHFGTVCHLDSNGYSHDPYTAFSALYAFGVAEECRGDTEADAFSALKSFSDERHDWLVGCLSYDLKNQVEALTSSGFDGLDAPLMHFFRPVLVLIQTRDQWKLGCLPGYGRWSDPDRVMAELVDAPLFHPPASASLQMTPRVSKERYLQRLASIRDHILRGDVYEMNYCIEFFAEQARLDPLPLYRALNQRSPMPFAAYYQHEDFHLLCASPERFLARRGNKLISQPIKGTIGRDPDVDQDAKLRLALAADGKERSENVMIVDLVRNDLSRSARKASVRVEELFGIYSFRHIHHMISTVSADLHPDCHFVDAIRMAFPMGSMTGAPKIRAMQLIEDYEDTRRGLFSGCVGYITPEKDFDFNVVIRSIMYNQKKMYLGFMAGGAITAGSVPEQEYEECLLKARAMMEVLGPGSIT